MVYTIKDNIGICKGCRQEKDLRFGWCYFCCVWAEFEAGDISEDEFLHEMEWMNELRNMTKEQFAEKLQNR